MTCPCIQSGPIATCTDELLIGTIDAVNTDVTVYIRNISSGKVSRFDTVSSPSGEVTIDTTEFNFGTSMGYEITITLTGDPITETIEFTTGDQTGECIWFKVTDVEGAAVAELTAIGEAVSVSTNRYIQIDSDYTWQPIKNVVEIIDTTNVVTVTMLSPDQYAAGDILIVKDTSGNASINNPVLLGNFEGAASYAITSDLGSITFYSNGVDKFFITAWV